jgi:hypothetical protein
MKKPVARLAVTVQLPASATAPHALRPAFKPVLDLKTPKRENSFAEPQAGRGVRPSKNSPNAGFFPQSR